MHCLKLCRKLFSATGIVILVSCSTVPETNVDSNLQSSFEERIAADRALTSPHFLSDLARILQISEDKTLTTEAIRIRPNGTTPTPVPLSFKNLPKMTSTPIPTLAPIPTPTPIPTPSLIQSPQIVSTPTYSPPTATPSASDYYNQGIVYYKRGKHREAISAFGSSIMLAPKHAKSYWHRGRSFNKIKQNQKALRDLEQAIRLDPDYPYPYVDQGHIFTDLRDYEKAIQSYAKAITLRPNEAEAYYHRALAYRQSNSHKESNTDYQTACSLSDKYCRTLTELGLCSLSEMSSRHLIWGTTNAVRVSAWLNESKITEVKTGGRVKVNAPYSLDMDVCDTNGNSLIGKTIQFKLDNKWARETTRLFAGEKTRIDFTFSTYR